MERSHSEYIYILGDADHVREKIERYLLNGDIENLAKLSRGITNAVLEMKSTAILTMDADVIMAGGDDIFFRVLREKYQKSLIQELSERFYDSMGGSFSFGVGETIEEAYINLRRAKSFGQEKIVEKSF